MKNTMKMNIKEKIAYLEELSELSDRAENQLNFYREQVEEAMQNDWVSCIERYQLKVNALNFLIAELDKLAE